jgi:hypothetical protein
MKKSKKLILSTISKKEEYKYVGTNLPPHTFNYLSLYIIANKISKSNLFKELIDNWIKQKIKDGDTELKLIYFIIKRINYEWSQMSNKSKSAFEKFKKSIQLELMNKGLKLKQINKILDNIEEEWKEKEPTHPQ